MFKKRKEKRAQELNESRLATEQKFATDIENASRIEDHDPAKKVIALQEVRQAIGEKLRSERIDRNQSARNAGFKTQMGFLTAGVGGSFTTTAIILAAGVVTPVAAIVSLAGGVAVVTGVFVNPLREKAVKKKLEKGAEGHIEKMDALKSLADQKTNKIWSDNKTAIKASPLFNEASRACGLGRDPFMWANGKIVPIQPANQPKP